MLRVFTRRAAIVSVVLGLCPTLGQARQNAAPNLTRQQRAALQAVVRAVDTAVDVASVDEAEWPIHVLRASDGSHYVAFSLLSPPNLQSNQPVMLYVRLATRRDDRSTSLAVTERSAVAEWLAGQRATPLPQKRGISFGDMPTFGAGAIAARGPGPQSLQLLEMERERAREKQEASERERKAALEGTAATRGPSPMLPFEDFDARAVALPDSSGSPVLRRSLTAGPGDYTLTLGWVDPAAKDLAAAVRVVRRGVALDVASTTKLGLSSVIVADHVGVRDVPFGAGEQAAHPYSIGTTEIVPARDHSLTNDERLALVVQVVNPRASSTGKPDLAVGFRIFRMTETAQESVGTIAPQVYNQATLPSDFDVTKGHPVFAAVAMSLRTFKRGTYRAQIVAEDRLSGANTATDVAFTVVGTAAALLRDAPALGTRFRRDSVASRAVVESLVALLRPQVPSSALASALDAARSGRFVDLVRDDEVSGNELGARTVLRALGFFALGDTPASVAGPLRVATQQSAPAAAVHLLTGAVRAAEGNDRDAVAAWQSGIDDGLDAAAPLAVDALLRQSEWTRAAELAQRSLLKAPASSQLLNQLAAAHIGAGRIAEAIEVLEPALVARPDDSEAQWLMLHAMFAGFVRREPARPDAEERTRFHQLATRYVAANGPHAALAREWSDAIF